MEIEIVRYDGSAQASPMGLSVWRIERPDDNIEKRTDSSFTRAAHDTSD
jgi:hypothetical protein